MKRFSTIFILAIASFILSSCGDTILGGKVKLGDQMQYNMTFVFQDVEGNNLAKGIDLNEWIPANEPKEQATSGEVKDYKLDIILSDPGELYNNKLYNVNDPEAVELAYNPPVLMYRHTEENIYIENYFGLYSGVVSPQDKLTYELTCPHIFGDNDKHVITTYWKTDLGEKKYDTYFLKCYKIEFDGNVITDIDLKEEKYYIGNYVTLTVNR